MENIGLYFLALIIPLVAQIYVSVTYKKYRNIENNKNLTGFEVARKILDKNGLNDMYIVETRGNLTDHYDPTRKTIKLSSDIFHGTSIASIAVAAHECGHAIQDKDKYIFIIYFLFTIFKKVTILLFIYTFLINIRRIYFYNIVSSNILLYHFSLLFRITRQRNI